MKRGFRACTVLVLSLLSIALTGQAAEQPQPKAAPPAGKKPAEVTVRFSKNEGFNRIVLESADEQFIKQTTVTSAPGKITVQFPADTSLAVQRPMDFEASLKGRTYTVTVPGAFQMKVLKLQAPPRVSIDIISGGKEDKLKATGPAVAPADFPNIRVMIDPGHGGYDLGLLFGEVREKDVTLSVAREIESAILKRNRPVFLTRKSDQFLSITDRALSANQRVPDLFISIHATPSDRVAVYLAAAEPAGAEVQAAELYSLSSRQRRFIDESRAFSETLGRALKEEFKVEVVSREMPLPLLNSIGAAAVLVEMPKDVAVDKTARTRLSEAILKGITAYANR